MARRAVLPSLRQQPLCHVTKPDRVQHRVRWEQVARVDPVVSNPTVSEFTRKEARRHRSKRSDGKPI